MASRILAAVTENRIFGSFVSETTVKNELFLAILILFFVNCKNFFLKKTQKWPKFSLGITKGRQFSYFILQLRSEVFFAKLFGERLEQILIY